MIKLVRLLFERSEGLRRIGLFCPPDIANLKETRREYSVISYSDRFVCNMCSKKRFHSVEKTGRIFFVFQTGSS